MVKIFKMLSQMCKDRKKLYKSIISLKNRFIYYFNAQTETKSVYDG